MKVFLNGAACDLPEGACISDAVRVAGAPADGRGVAVALEGDVVPRGSWDTTTVGEGQRIEVLQAVQGG